MTFCNNKIGGPDPTRPDHFRRTRYPTGPFWPIHVPLLIGSGQVGSSGWVPVGNSGVNSLILHQLVDGLCITEKRACQGLLLVLIIAGFNKNPVSLINCFFPFVSSVDLPSFGSRISPFRIASPLECV